MGVEHACLGLSQPELSLASLRPRLAHALASLWAWNECAILVASLETRLWEPGIRPEGRTQFQATTAVFPAAGVVSASRASPADQNTPVSSSLDDSIYVFPNPSTTPPFSPPSPSSSLFSAPTDFDPSDTFSLGSRSRSCSSARPTLVEDPDRTITGPRTRYISPNELEIDVELWDLESTTDASSILRDELEAEIERTNARGLDLAFLHNARKPHRARLPPGFQGPTFSMLPSALCTPPPTPNASPFATARSNRWTEWEHTVRPLAHRRSRTLSRLRTSTRPRSPHPRINLPLLSVFASALSVDLEDPALSLLTRADPGDDEAVLFPGHTTAQLLAGSEQDEGDEEEEDAEERDDEQPHGLPKLLLASIADQSAVALRSLREGLLCVYRAARHPAPSRPNGLVRPLARRRRGLCQGRPGMERGLGDPRCPQCRLKGAMFTF
ncbi:uncharacterized protein BXZ73DRAFT_79656 [Epithele typhae]|uniref:uncharacterized protein n=1 Tax=Epithele typhae TaxID=378194 RepID=UPI002007777F|nr:uncharacterized protein BXZ73DRAFT_79656 [Epithele typhae]KAH9922829.1 hypothetical protein BXZ73DRAFT_79656 [Epithele typhae]